MRTSASEARTGATGHPEVVALARRYVAAHPGTSGLHDSQVVAQEPPWT